MDDVQLRREYEKFCSMCVNPPSFESWLRSRSRAMLQDISPSTVKFMRP